jgi:hypothetical protein
VANQKHVTLLKKGVTQWNTWREQHPDIQPDLSGANLGNIDLSYIDFHGANLNRVGLNRTILYNAILREATLINAHLNWADLRDADLSGANLERAVLNWTNLSDVDLSGANLRKVTLEYTIFARIDLRQVRGLTEIWHNGPSRVELHTILLPQDGSALHFLRGVGVPDEWIEDYRTRMMHPIQYHSLFISYSNKDEQLARRLHADLQISGVRCWFAPEDLKIGTKFRQRIDEAIHQQDKLLLLLSEHSIASTWVENEVETALEKEDQQQREVLFPIRLDDAVMQTSQAWAATLRRTRHIGDFSRWTDSQAYQSAFDRLLQDLRQN